MKNWNVLLVLAVLMGVIVIQNHRLPMVLAQYEIKEITPELKIALDGRKARREDLNAAKSQGKVGETNRGYVKALEGSAQGLVDAENRDRKIIYETIAQQHNLSSEMGTIEKVFAQEQRDRARSGDKIQDESGNWTTK